MNSTENNLSGYFRKRLLITTIMTGVIAFSAGIANAQNVPQDVPQDVAEEDEIIVTGIRQSLEKNLDFKRDSDSVADLISAEEIGKFPDKNVADALQRVPGVVISRDGGEGARVSVRGLSPGLTYTQLNENYIASAAGEPQRSFLYTLLPSNMVASVEVLKSPQAKYDEGGVGGTVILRTREPLDQDANSGFISLEGTYSDTTDKIEPNYSGSYSWKNKDGTLGLLAAYTNQDRTNRTARTSIEDWNFHTDQDTYDALVASGELHDGTQRRDPLVDNFGNGQTYSNVWVPTAVVGIVEEQDREREGIQLSGQWRPTDRVDVNLDYLRFNLGGNFDRYRLVLPEWNYGNGIVPGGITVQGNTVVGISTAAPSGGRLDSPQYAGDRVVRSSESNTIALTTTYDAETWDLRAIAGYTEAKGGDDEQFFGAVYSTNRWDGDDQPIVNAVDNWAWNLQNGGGARITSTSDLGGIQNRPDGIALDNVNSSFTDSKDKETYGQLDFTFDTARFASGLINTFDVGVKYRDHTIDRRVRNIKWDDANDPANCSRFIPWDPESTCPSWIGSGNFVTDLSLHPSSEVLADRILLQQPVGNITGGALDVVPFSGIDWDGFRAWLFERFGEPTVETSDSNIYEVNEKILAGYAQANFERNRARGNVGVRLVNTDLETTVYNRSLTPDGLDSGFVNRESSKTDVLPSFNIAYDLTEDIVLRGAVSKVLSRVPYGSLGGAETLIYEAETNTVRGSGGNPDLQPFEAWSFDGSAEWYYAPGSALSLAVYRKDVSNFIVNASTSVQRVVGGETVTVSPYTTSVNGADVNVTGFEIALQHDFQNGFGVLANYTYNDSEQTEVTFEGVTIGATALPGVADYQMNLVGYYENEDFTIRLAYNRVGERPGNVARGLLTVLEEYQQLDLSAGYNINEHISLNLAAINLTEEIARSYSGAEERLASATYPGRRFYVGATYRF